MPFVADKSVSSGRFVPDSPKESPEQFMLRENPALFEPEKEPSYLYRRTGGLVKLRGDPGFSAGETGFLTGQVVRDIGDIYRSAEGSPPIDISFREGVPFVGGTRVGQIPSALVPALTTTARVAAPIAAAMSMATEGATLPSALALTGLAGAAGEASAQQVEKDIGMREELSAPEILSMGLLTSVPGARQLRAVEPFIDSSRALRLLTPVAEGAAIGAAQPVVESAFKGELPESERVKQGALFGGLVGSAFSVPELLRPSAPNLANQASLAAKQSKQTGNTTLQQNINPLAGVDTAVVPGPETFTPVDALLSRGRAFAGEVEPRFVPESAAQADLLRADLAAAERASAPLAGGTQIIPEELGTVAAARRQAVAEGFAGAQAGELPVNYIPEELAFISGARGAAADERLGLGMVGGTAEEADLARKGLAPLGLGGELQPKTEAEIRRDWIQEAADTKGVDYQYSVMDFGPGYPRVTQIDAISKEGEGLASGMVNEFRAAGAEIPEVPSWVPQGKYTLSQINQIIKEGQGALQKRQTESLLQRQSQEAGEAGSGRVGVEPQQQGAQAPGDSLRKAQVQEPLAQQTEVQQILESVPPFGAQVPPQNLAERARASRMRQERGAISPASAAPLAGAGAGGATGYALTEREPGESDEQYGGRRLRNMLLGAMVGAGGTLAAERALTKGKPSDIKELPAGRLARALGLSSKFKAIDEEVSDFALWLERTKNVALRGSPARKPFYDALRRANDRIASRMDEVGILLSELRRKMVQNYSAAERPGIEQSLNSAFSDISSLEQVPPDLRDEVLKIFKIREENATQIAQFSGLTEAMSDTILANGGDYLARRYSIFNLENEAQLRAWKNAIPKEDREAALDAIQEAWMPRPKSKEEQRATESVLETIAGDKENAVEIIKSFRPWMTDNDSAKVAAWIAAGKQSGNPKVKALYMELVNPTDVSREEAEVLLNQFLDRNQFEPFMLGRREIGGKDVSSLFRRKDIDPRLRKVLGEIEDPFERARQTVEIQARLIENDRAQQEMVAIGEQMGIMTRDKAKAEQSGWREFVPGGSNPNSAYDNWSGVYIDPVFADEFSKVSTTTGPGSAVGHTLRALTGAFKYGKVILAPGSRAVNLMGSYLNNAMNGRAVLPTAGYWDGIKSTLVANGLLNSSGRPDFDAIMQLRKEMVSQGLLDQSVLGKDLAENLSNPVSRKWGAKLDKFVEEISNPVARKAAMAGKFVLSGNEFKAGDDISRVAGYLSEKENYRRAFPEMADEEIQRLAASAMRQTSMMYSEVPAVLRKYSGYNIIQPFINFPYAAGRSIVNTARLAGAEIAEGRKSGNEALARNGYKRAAALTLGLGLSSSAGMGWLNNRNLGITPEIEDAVRDWGPDYIKDSPLLFDEKVGPDKVSFVEASYVAYPSLFTSVVEQAFSEGQKEGLGAAIERGAQVAGEPFFGLGPILSMLENVRNNKTEWGSQIYNPQDPDKNRKIAAYMWRTLQPAGIGTVERFRRASSEEGKVDPSTGKVYSVEDELKRLAGWRVTTFNPRYAYPRLISQDYKNFTEAGRLFVQEARSRGATTESTDAAFAKQQEVQRELFDQMVKRASQAQLFGLSKRDVILGMVNAGIPDDMIGQVISNTLVEKPKRVMEVEEDARRKEREIYLKPPQK